MSPSPPDLWQRSLRLLSRATNDRHHHFRTPVFTTIDAEGRPQARTLVLRRFEQERLRCYTDRRSAKFGEILLHPWVQWLFWDPKSSIQLSVAGPTTEIDPVESLEAFRSLPKHGRKSYATIDKPGSTLPEPTDGLPNDWESMNLSETDYALPNFCVLETRMEEVDILHLDRAGHRRLKARRNDDGEWGFAWVVP